MRFKLIHVAGSLLLTALLIGCSKTTSIEGTVKFNGRPIEEGAISFIPTGTQGKSFGAVITKGKYSVADAQPGERTLIVTAIDPSRVAKSRAEGMEMLKKAKAEGRSPSEAIFADIIPPDAEGNGQIVEIKFGRQTLDVEIKTK